MKLRPPPRDYTTCAVVRCRSESEYLDSTGWLADGDVPLCERHWSERLDDEGEQKKSQQEDNDVSQLYTVDAKQ